MATKHNSFATFVWQGFTKRGAFISGESTTNDLRHLQADLHKQGITVTNIKPKKHYLNIRLNNLNKRSDIRELLRNLAIMLQAGLSLTQALASIAQGNNKIRTRELISQIKQDVTTGLSLADALKKHPQHFPALICHLIQSGERSGALDSTLAQAVNYLDKTAMLKQKIIKAMLYPLTILTSAMIITLLLLIFIVPQFSAIYQAYHANLPKLTLTVINLSNSLRQYWFIWLLSASVIGSALIVATKKSKKFQYFLDHLLVKVKLIGKINQKIITARIATTLTTMLNAGIPITDALQSSAATANNQLYRQALLSVREHIIGGQSLHMSLAATKLFPPMIIQMIAIGEQTGRLNEMLNKIADTYANESENVLSALMSLLEPLIMLFLGVLLGGLVLAMYLPIFSLGSIF